MCKSVEIRKVVIQFREFKITSRVKTNKQNHAGCSVLEQDEQKKYLSQGGKKLLNIQKEPRFRKNVPFYLIDFS